ncbi:thiazole tautomerase (transcriptional regulator TenI) [Halobacillus alkaliphilus]|uniref:Thiazole tautomerase (Transcriptional regulator TenI) n=1 Tax=Halobacillus alkaliphilus TaxID=396056 RepID=A0A1I2JQP1_9BACI|nr:thiamine phosphate synthase [Halobacillus alkaliphilus]SFF55076.1 thiazole tautomerase (transcriptional regulator TenI) [Halobacillus alkaliphilus]
MYLQILAIQPLPYGERFFYGKGSGLGLKRELHVLSDGKKELDEFCQMALSIQSAATAIHLREKHRPEEEIQKWVHTLIKEGISSTKIIVNSHYSVAGRWGAAGVQLPEDGPSPETVKRLYPELRVGCSIHGLEAGYQKEREGADYLLFGNVYQTESKSGLKGKGVKSLESLTEAVSIPVIAIGGIHISNLERVLQTKVSGIAVMSSIAEAHNPGEKAWRFQTRMQRSCYHA